MQGSTPCDMGDACGRTVKPNRKIRMVWSIFHAIPTHQNVISNLICPYCWNTKRVFIMKVLGQTAMDAVKIKYKQWGMEKNEIAWPTEKMIDVPMQPLEDLKPKPHSNKTPKGVPTGKVLKDGLLVDDKENKVPDDMKEVINKEHEVTPESMATLNEAIEESDAAK